MNAIPQRTGQLFGAVLMGALVLSAPHQAGAQDAEVDETVVTNATARNNTFTVGGFIGGLFPSDDHEFYDPRTNTQVPLSSIGPDIGLRLGYMPLKYLGVEAEGKIIPIGVEEDRDRAMILGLGVHILAQIPMKVTPLAVLGLGTMGIRSDEMDSLSNDADFIGYGGVGALYHLTESLAVRGDFRLISAPKAHDLNGTTLHSEVLVGLTWAHSLTDVKWRAPVVKASVVINEPVGDRDGDGFNDDVDTCPDVKETVNNFEDEDGCPDAEPDTDGDGLVDSNDECPTEAEDVDSFEDDNGCPDTDNDQDGVVDASDMCPVKAGVVENRGCPDTDRDGDTVVDREDNCPDEPGTVKNHGCKKKQLVVLTKDRIVIADKVFFRVNRAKIQRRSFALLNNVAAVLASHPEILNVEIEGHTDSQGDDLVNKELSERRAGAVKVYLIERGIAADRLSSIGFGEEVPVADNGSKAGRAMNRRVEFKILDIQAPAPSP